MRRTYGRRRALCAGALAAVAVLLAVIVPASVAGASTGQSIAPNTPGPALPLHVQLLGINLQLNVPLSLRGLLGIGGSGGSGGTSTPPTTTPPSRPASPPPTTPTGQPRTSTPATQSSQGGAVNQGGATRQGGGATTAGATGSSRHPSKQPTATAPATHATPTPTKSSAEARGGFVLTNQLSDTGAVLLIAIVIATAIAMAVVVRLGGRRGSRHV